MNQELIEQYKLMHKSRKNYGSSDQYFDKVIALCKKNYIKSAIDWGCGQGKLSNKLKDIIEVFQYDPAIEEFNNKPSKKYDMVFAIDVLEHLDQNDYEEDILEMISHSNKLLFFNISCRPALVTLPNGENAHTMLRNQNFWITFFKSIDSIGKIVCEFDKSHQNLEIIAYLNKQFVSKNHNFPIF